MKAKKFLSSTLKFVLLAVVGAFLALHSINLFTFVFPADQSYLAWLGFGLTGFGAVVYLLMFLWEGGTALQKSVSLAMAVVCSIGEVLAAIFGMQIESWAKAGFTLNETDFQAMLLVVGALSIAHFFALIAYFAGDQIRELLSDADGDGIPNIIDPDYKKSSSRQTNRPMLTNAAETDAAWKAEAKALGMWDPNDPNDTPFERSRPEIHKAIVEGRKAEGQGNGHKAATDPTQRQR
jgi:hypothetical protein